jgi:hypothetical protein
VHALDNNARERCPYIGPPNLVVDLADPDLGNIRIVEREVTVCFRLFEFKFRDQVRAL